MTSKICIIVPITTAGFRDQSATDSLSRDRASVVFQHLHAGPVSVESAVDEALAGPGVISAAVEAAAAGFDAIIIDCMLDPAVDAAREAVAIPVIACGETTMSLATQAGGSFSIVTVLDRQDRLFRLKSRLYGLETHLRSVRSIDVPVLALDSQSDETLERTIRESLVAIKHDGAESIIFGCTGMLGHGVPVARALREQGHDVPVFDPLPVAVDAALQAVRDGTTHSKSDYPYPERKGYAGMQEWSGLKALLLDTTS